MNRTRMFAVAGVLFLGATIKAQNAEMEKTLDITMQVLDGRNGKALADQHVLVFTGLSSNAVKTHAAHTGVALSATPTLIRAALA